MAENEVHDESEESSDGVVSLSHHHKHVLTWKSDKNGIFAIFLFFFTIFKTNEN